MEGIGSGVDLCSDMNLTARGDETHPPFLHLLRQELNGLTLKMKETENPQDERLKPSAVMDPPRPMR